MQVERLGVKILSVPEAAAPLGEDAQLVQSQNLDLEFSAVARKRQGLLVMVLGLVQVSRIKSSVAYQYFQVGRASRM